MKPLKNLLYYWFIVLLVIILPDSVKGFALILIILLWISGYFTKEQKEKRRQEEERREKDNENAERMRMNKEKWWWYGDENSPDTIKTEEESKYTIIMTDERPGTVKTYDEYAEKLRTEDTPQDSIIHYSETKEPYVRNIEDPYEDSNSAVGFSDGYSEDDDRGPDSVEDDEEESENTKKSSLDLDDEYKNEHWAVHDEDWRIEQDPAHELKQREYREELRNYRWFNTDFSVGEVIEHHKFWKGTILSITRDVAAIHFKDWGIKKLNLRVAPIRKWGF